METFQQARCRTCHEMWPTPAVVPDNMAEYVCHRCKKDPMKFSLENDMLPNPSAIPLRIRKMLKNLTPVEEMLISPVLPIMAVYKLPGGQSVSRGFTANFRQDVNDLCKQLPRLPTCLPVLIGRRRGQQNTLRECKVRRARYEMNDINDRVLAVLEFLCEYHPLVLALGIAIEHANLSQLPKDNVLDLAALEGTEEEMEQLDDIARQDLGPEMADRIP
ncbi:hypothetical protein ROZALSC1DRAFT_29660 [Rozella allomycis CSF55]|uniref:DUF6570 domain-containing protein n=1 Tax=Rozella allomycis (strain CSF55) TaxID=988480 RepID=A0A075B1B7_ROZAC|nr:hypothetical protein O9G_005710 [Rozella allomycis CSF55]RKP18673.1 hypothetical protein ROZALSC1DRAFT_29660 [Rozella allomycis CSF55]|eukprot:EPZ36337.1 hypothetical protein O9G_005710 [Rozella allomycis CSF55]